MGISKEESDKTVKYIMNLVNSEEASFIAQNALDVMGTISPVTGVPASAISNLMNDYYKLHLNRILKGLSRGTSEDRYKNELYAYITKSSERAYYVASTLKKAMMAECPKACEIMGLILRENMDKDRGLSRVDLIVCKALENATDNDLTCFMFIMESFLFESISGQKMVVFGADDEDAIEEGELTCNWAVYNRLFSGPVIDEFDDEDSQIHVPSAVKFKYYVDKPAERLKELIEEAGQIMYYQ